MSERLPAAELAAALREGRPALFPTDTLPALAAAPAHAELLWACKDRPREKPLILMGADLDQLLELLGTPWPEPWLLQARRCWPGPVTLVLPIPGPVTEALNPGGSTLGLRVPDCGRTRELLRLSGPLATTSANRSGESPVRDPDEAAATFPEVPQLAPLPWPSGSGVASTVLAWSPQQAPGRSWRVLRAGASLPESEEGQECRA